MTAQTRLVRDDVYEDMGASYQCVQIATLDAALQDHGVMDADLRRKVCESFAYSMGNFHDQGWFKTTPDGPPLFPLLCFTERFLDSDTSIEEIGAVYVPSQQFSYFEYAGGNVELVHDGDPNGQIVTGGLRDLDDA